MKTKNEWWSDGLDPTVPVIDATKPLVFTIRGSDIKGATSRNPEKCVAARGARRVLGKEALGVKMCATVAYVHWGIFIERYEIADETRKMIKAYDKSDYYPTGVSVKLRPPAPSNRLGAPRRASRTSTGTGPKKPNSNQYMSNAKSPWMRHAFQDCT